MRIGTVIKTLLKVAVSAGLIGILLVKMDMGRFMEAIKRLNVGMGVLAVILFVVAQTLSTWRWKTLLPNAHRFGKLFSLYFIGSFFNNFLPTAIGGDVVKTYYLYKEEKDLGAATTAVFMDRYVGMAALLLVGIGGLYGARDMVGAGKILLAYGVLCAAYLGSGIIIWGFSWERWVKKMQIFHQPLMEYRRKKGSVAKAFGISIGVQGLVILCVVVLAAGMDIPVATKYCFAFVPLAAVVSMVPASISGLGLREGAMAYLFGNVGVRIEEAVALSLLWYATVAISSLIGGIEYLRAGMTEKRTPEG